MNTLSQDLRYSLRMLLKRPGFTLVAVITLALGIGANSAVFSVVNAVLLRPLPYPNAEQLIMIWGKLPAHGLEQLNASPPEFVDYRDRNQAFAAIAAYASLGRNLTGAGEPERINVTFVTAGFFAALDTPLRRGRAFFDAEAQLPDVKSVGIVNFLPFSGSGNRRNISVEGKPENPINVEFRISNPDYFRVMGIQLRKGRLFDEHDRDNSTYVAVVNETFTRIFLPDEEPLGKRIKMGGMNSPFRWLAIAGVVKDLKHRGLDAETRPEMYIPYLQPPLADWNIQSMFLVVRTENEPQRLIASVPGIVQQIDREQPVYAVSTMQQLLNQSVAARRFSMLLMAIFAALALALAGVGIYGVMSQAVTQRTREIGIRMALGAQAADVLRLIVGQGLKLTIIGVMAGLVTALALTRLIESLLFGTSATDPLTFAAVALLLTAVALLACYIPARRATKVDPMIALRYE